MRFVLLVVVLLFAATAAGTLVAFSADVTVLYDPSMQGALKGKMWYQYDGTNNYKKLLFTLADNSGKTANYTHIFNYTSGTGYLKCPKNCSASLLDSTIEYFFPLSGEAVGTSAKCSSNKRDSSTSDSVVNTIGFDSTGAICYAVYGSGRRIEFSNVAKRTTVFDSSVFSISGWNCPSRTCNAIMDLMLILDVSGSIDDNGWAALKDFSKKLATAFSLSATATNFGVIAFSNYADLVLDFSSSSSAVQSAIANDVPRIGSSTCIGCGIYTAIDSFSRRTSTRKAMNPKNVTIMITDGGNNKSPTVAKTTPAAYLTAAVNAYKSSPYNGLSIVVSINTTDYNITALNQVVTNSSYLMGVSGYTSLLTILDKLIKTTCQDYPSSSCSSTCLGFCGCNQECLCPNYCTTGGNECIVGSCGTISGVMGCWNSSLTCSDGSACTDDTCDTSTGCVFTSLDCSSSDLCQNPACSNKTGCYTQPVVCTQTDKCYTYSCNSTDGKCHGTPVDCDDGNACTTDYCSSTAGCLHYTNCSDGDPCTDDVCVNKVCTHNATTCVAQDLCHNATCKAGVGCVSSAVTCSSLDSCHSYSCSAGQCVQDALPDNTTCLNCAKNPCNASSVATCSFFICTEDENSSDFTGRMCTQSTNISDSRHPCNDGNPCTTDSCESDGCHNVAFDGTISGDLCSWKICNTATGEISVVNQSCAAASSACYISYCDSTTGSCGTKALCDDAPSACSDSVCTLINGSATCSYPDKCSNTACSIASCSNGTCSYTARDCDDGNFCTIDACNTSVSSGSGCYYTENSCSDGNTCTNDTCDNTTQQCNHDTPFCYDGLYCTQDICTPNANTSLPPKCTFTEITCTMNYTLNLTSKQNRCYQALCSESQQCHWEFVASSNSSACQICVANTSTAAASGTCTSDTSFNSTAAIAAGVVAGIVIAVIVGVAGFSAASAAGTYKLIKTMKQGKGLAAHNNPMYSPSDNEMINPAYATK